MTGREDTIKELTAAEITKWVERPTQARVEMTQKELVKRATAIKRRYDALPEGMR